MEHIDLELTAQHQQSLHSIYMSLSVCEQDLFDVDNYLSFIVQSIESIYPETFRLIETLELQEQPNLINQKLVELIKYCKDSKEYQFNGAYVFITFCDYFELDEHKVFGVLHPKLQTIIKKHLKCIIGEESYNSFERIKTKDQGYTVQTLFEMFG